MLRLIVLVLILANAGYYTWVNGMLAPYGLAPLVQTEPQRMAQQIKPQALRVVTPNEASLTQQSNPTPPSSAAECLQVGIFNDEQAMVLKERLNNALPAGSWQLDSVLEPAKWLVYMGKYSSADAVIKKQVELRSLGVPFEPLTLATLEPGLSLGSFETRSDADLALARIAKRGVKTAKVVQERTELRGQRLKIAAVTADLRNQLDSIKPQLAGKVFLSCK